MIQNPPTSALKTSNDSTYSLCKRLMLGYIRPHIKPLLIAAFCMVLEAASTAGNAWMMQPVMDKIFMEKNMQLLYLIPVGIVVLALVKGFSGYTHTVFLKQIGQRMVGAMQVDMFSHLMHADVELFSRHSSGKLISRFSHDISIIRRNLTHVMVGLTKESLTLVFLLGVMFIQSLELAIIGFVLFPIAILPVLKLGRRMRKVSGATNEAMEQFTGRLDDTFQAVKIVKAYGREDFEVDRAKTVIHRITELYNKTARTESASSPMMEALSGLAVALVVFYGGLQVLQGETTAGSFFSFIAALLMAYRPFKSLSSINTSLQEGAAALRRVYAMLDSVPTIKDAPNASVLHIASGEAPSITFNHVSFIYPSGHQALSDVHLYVPAGKTVALVGASGGGKSTIFSLTMRFYDPTGGAIQVNETDIRGVTLQSLRQHIAVVNQEATLFDDTIRANIAYGKPDASEADIIAAAQAANAHDFIMEQPQGYDTEIGQQGTRLSGGQRQRIAIARAMLRNSPILLLDEATSALDTASEKHVQQALHRLMQGRTTMVIAHRLSTVMHADIIYVIDKGCVLEQGNHTELLAKQGAYYQLYTKQFSAQDGAQP